MAENLTLVESFELTAQKTKEYADTKTVKHLLSYNGSQIKEGNTVLTYAAIHAMLMDSPDFVVLVYNDRAYHPNRVSNEQIVFITSYVSNGYLQDERISISDSNVVTTTLGQAEMLANKVDSVNGITAANEPKKYPSVKAVKDYVGPIAEDVTQLKDDYVQLRDSKISKPIVADNGKTPRALNGDVEWVNVGQPTDVQTSAAVQAWLNAHPEATTTVQDKSITYKKFAEGTLGYVTPEMFGCPAVDAYYYNENDKSYYLDAAYSSPAEDMSDYFMQCISTGLPIILTSKYFIDSGRIVGYTAGKIIDINLVGVNGATIYTNPKERGGSLFNVNSATVDGVTFRSEPAYKIEVSRRDYFNGIGKDNWTEGMGYSSNITCVHAHHNLTMTNCNSYNNSAIATCQNNVGNDVSVLRIDNVNCYRHSFCINFSDNTEVYITNSYLELSDTITEDSYIHTIYTWNNPNANIYIANVTNVCHGSVELVRFRDKAFNVIISDCRFINDDSIYAIMSCNSRDPADICNIQMSNCYLKNVEIATNTTSQHWNVENCYFSKNHNYFANYKSTSGVCGSASVKFKGCVFVLHTPLKNFNASTGTDDDPRYSNTRWDNGAATYLNCTFVNEYGKASVGVQSTTISIGCEYIAYANNYYVGADPIFIGCVFKQLVSPRTYDAQTQKMFNCLDIRADGTMIALNRS